jgi:hypothetical protein
LFTEKTPVAQALQPVVLAIVFGNHLQAGGTAVHGVKLVGEGEGIYLLIDYWGDYWGDVKLASCLMQKGIEFSTLIHEIIIIILILFEKRGRG